MISFALRCRPHGHGFDAWFRSSEDWRRQSADGLVSCPVCGSGEVEKGLMAPALVSGGRAAGQSSDQSGEPATEAPPPAAPAPAVPVAAGPPPEMAEAFARLQALSREVRARSTYVGDRFAHEARRIHFGEAPARGIYGEATPAEIEGLNEDGIVAVPLPPLPEDRN